MPLSRVRLSAPESDRGGGTGIRQTDLRWAWGAIALLLALRLGYSVWVPPNPDEAYYWLWGRYPALSYYDHPPLLAWVQGLTYQLFGRSAWALRLPNWLSLAGLLATYAWLLRQLSPQPWRSQWLLLTATLLTSPLFFNFTLLAWNDHWLLLTVLLANTSLLQWLRPAPGQPPRRRWLLLASQALGLAGLCKYSALLVGLAMALTVLLIPAARHRLRQWRDLLAAVSGGVWLLPVLLWNAGHGQQSFDYYLTRTGGWQFKPL
jgi:4-amino-4-deoxy-L-arabinose transferase-like glycosyltransferase